jgi:hypothetical protein
MDMQVREPAKDIDTLLVLGALLKVLGTKALAFATLGMTFTLYCWAMWRLSVLAFAIAGAFGLGVLLPVLWIGYKGHGHE